MLFKYWIVVLFWLCTSAGLCAPEEGIQRFERAQLSWHSGPTAPDQFEAGSIELPHDWEHVQFDHTKRAWYRIQFDASPAEFSAVLIERACTNAHIWLNGILISQSGSLHEPISRHCYHPHLAALPAQLLKPQGNVLDIQLAGYPFLQVAARQRHAGLSPVRIGSQVLMQAHYERQYFWNITVAQIIGVSLGVFSFAMLMMFAVRRQDNYFLYFGLMLGGWALIGVRLYWQEIPLAGWMTEIVITALLPPVVAFGIQFLLHYVNRPRAWIARLLLAQAIVVPVLMLLLGAQRIFPIASIVFTLLCLEFIAVLVYAGFMAWRSMRTDFWVMGCALVLAGCMVVAEIAVQNAWLPLPQVHLIHFGVPLVFFALMVRLVQQFARALTNSERLAQELEHRVAQKALEIEANYEQISHLRANQAAQHERQRIAADLHDDLGAKLLSIIHMGNAHAQQVGGAKIAQMARQAMDDMRLSVRGITGQDAMAEQMLADWRAETIERIHGAGLQADWLADEPPLGLSLGARTQIQLTRILRESVSNTIRHAHAQRCTVRVRFDAGWIDIQVDDDGCGFPSAGQTMPGHGLNNIERRARVLGGKHRFGRSALGGASVGVCIPLALAASLKPMQ